MEEDGEKTKKTSKTTLLPRARCKCGHTFTSTTVVLSNRKQHEKSAKHVEYMKNRSKSLSHFFKKRDKKSLPSTSTSQSNVSIIIALLKIYLAYLVE